MPYPGAVPIDREPQCSTIHRAYCTFKVTWPVLVAYWVGPPAQPWVLRPNSASIMMATKTTPAFLHLFLARVRGKSRSGIMMSTDNAPPDVA